MNPHNIIRNLTSLIVIAIMSMTHNLQAQNSHSGNSDFKYSEEFFMDMDFEPNLATPKIPEKEKAAVKQYVRKVAEGLSKDVTVDLMRDDEVFIVTIPTDELFLPNDSLLMDDASNRFDPFFKLMSDPLMYKIVLAMHTDDTGSKKYCDYLSTVRMNSIYDMFMEKIENGELSEDLVIIPFAMGSSLPLVPNDTRKNRSENRRLEIYFIPGPKMIELAHKKALQ